MSKNNKIENKSIMNYILDLVFYILNLLNKIIRGFYLLLTTDKTLNELTKKQKQYIILSLLFLLFIYLRSIYYNIQDNEDLNEIYTKVFLNILIYILIFYSTYNIPINLIIIIPITNILYSNYDNILNQINKSLK